jgi:multidrug efflux pump subunit AcrB
VFSFSSPVYWLAIILSVIVAPVGAAILLTMTDRVLGISALIGLLMLLGIVVTNAVVLIDRVHANNVTRKMPLHDALIEAGDRRLRPILMTALATIGALSPLAIGLSKGAIIASELGTVVIGGLFSSTVLTLIVVPVAYDLLHPVHRLFARLVSPRRTGSAEAAPHTGSAD